MISKRYYVTSNISGRGGGREIIFNHFFFYLLYQLISYLSSFYEQQTTKSGIRNKNKKHSFPYKPSVMPSRVSLAYVHHVITPCHPCERILELRNTTKS